jgi:hypothetical protein
MGTARQLLKGHNLHYALFIILTFLQVALLILSTSKLLGGNPIEMAGSQFLGGFLAIPTIIIAGTYRDKFRPRGLRRVAVIIAVTASIIFMLACIVYLGFFLYAISLFSAQEYWF